jgi:hypothetical protein
MNAGLPADIQVQSFVISAGDLFCGTNTQGVWRMALRDTDIKNRNHPPAKRVAPCMMVAVRPGPMVAVEFSLSRNSRVLLAVYNLAGKKIA